MTEDEYGDELAGAARPELVKQSLEAAARTLQFRVEEFADLSDGRRLTLTDDRGWSTSLSGGRPADEQWAYLTVEAVKRDVRNVVLPDDAEETGDEHPWAWLTARLGALGVEATPGELRRLPYDVVLSPRLRARLSVTG